MQGSLSRSGRSPGEGYGNPFQYSCLENPMNRGASGLSLWGCKGLDSTYPLNNSKPQKWVFVVVVLQKIKQIYISFFQIRRLVSGSNQDLVCLTLEDISNFCVILNSHRQRLMCLIKIQQNLSYNSQFIGAIRKIINITQPQRWHNFLLKIYFLGTCVT